MIENRRGRMISAMLVVMLMWSMILVVQAAMLVQLRIDSKIMVGSIDLSLREVDGEGNAVSGESIQAHPGSSYSRYLYVENTGTHPAFVRISLRSLIADHETGESTSTEKIKVEIANNPGWIAKDGWFYYENVLNPGEKTQQIAYSVLFGTELDQNENEDLFEVDIVMHGLQSENNAEDPLGASGWPKE